MTLPKPEQRLLVAVAEQCAEARRPISTLIVMAAINARSGIDQDKAIVHLGSLKRQGLVRQDGDRWEATSEGHQAARQIMTGSLPTAPDPEPLPEGPPIRPKSRDTLRQGVGGAPRPVTRPDALGSAAPQSRPAELRREPKLSPKPVPVVKICRHCAVQFKRPDDAPIPHDRCERCHEEIEAPAFDDPDAPTLTGDGSGKALPAIKYPAHEERLAPPMSLDLLNRCAIMQMSLMAQARRDLDDGVPGALAEIQWLAETGKQLIAAGGAHG